MPTANNGGDGDEATRPEEVLVERVEMADQQYDDLREISLSSASSNESSADPAMRPDESGKPEQREAVAVSAAKRAKLEVPPTKPPTPTSDGASTQAAVVDYLSAKRAELGMPPSSSSEPMAVAVAVAVSDETGDGDSGSSAVALANSAGHKTSSPGNNDDNDVIINSRTRNAQYLRMIKENRTAYAKAATRSERKAIVGSLMDQWRKRGGRFLTRQKGVDAEADDGLVQKKIATALRKPKAKKAAVVPLRPGRHVLPQIGVVPQKVFLGGSDYDCDEAASLFLAKEDERAKAAAAAPSTSRGEDGRGGGPSASRAKPAKRVRLSILETSASDGGGAPPGAAGTPKAPSRSPSASRTPALLLSEDPAPSLGVGWVTRTYRRTSGRTAGTTDTYFYSPATSIKFRSLRNCRIFIGVLAEEGVGGDESAALRAYRERGHRL